MFGVKVKKEYAEKIRRLLLNKKILNSKKKIFASGNYVFMPILDREKFEDLRLNNAKIVDCDFPSRKLKLSPIKKIKKNLHLGRKILALLPNKFELIGDVLILNIPDMLEKYEYEIAEAYAKVLKAKTVLKDIGGIVGKYREPMLKLLYGKETETIHKENNVKFKLDTMKIMFSSGNIKERMRIAYLSNSSEKVVDMFAGIGYFSIPIALYSKPEKVYACEFNPIAYHYLLENIRLNRVYKNVVPLYGDCMKVAPEGIGDRVIMGCLNAENYLLKAMRILDKKGIIHYHTLSPIEDVPSFIMKKVKKTAEKFGRKAKLISYRKIKSYAPGIVHVVMDIEVLKQS